MRNDRGAGRLCVSRMRHDFDVFSSFHAIEAMQTGANRISIAPESAGEPSGVCLG